MAIQAATYKIYLSDVWETIHFRTSASYVGTVDIALATPEVYNISDQFVTGAILKKLKLGNNVQDSFVTLTDTDDLGKQKIPFTLIPSSQVDSNFGLAYNKILSATKHYSSSHATGDGGTAMFGLNDTYNLTFGPRVLGETLASFSTAVSPAWSGTPTQSYHLTTKAYVDLVSGYGISPLVPVKAASTENIPTLSGTTIKLDNVTLVAEDRVLIKNQTTDPKTNGVYIVKASAWVRSADANESNEISGALVTVSMGDTQKGYQYYQKTNVPNLTTTGQEWILFNNVVKFYAAGTGLEFKNAGGTDDGITFAIKASGVDTTQLKDGAVTNDKVSDTAAIAISKFAKVIVEDDASIDTSAAGVPHQSLYNNIATLIKNVSGEDTWSTIPGKSLKDKANLPLIQSATPTGAQGVIWFDTTVPS